MKKLQKLGIGVGILSLVLTSGLSASANKNVNVNAKVHPKSGIFMNFDSFSFVGGVGEAISSATYMNGTNQVLTPEMQVKFKNNYSVMMSASDFTTSGLTPTTLDSERLSVSIANGSQQSLSENPTVVDSGSATGFKTNTKSLNFNLNLTDANNNFTDNAVLGSLESETDFSTTITVSYSGL